MGRGLGRTQQTIMATLRERARPVTVVDLTYHVHYGPDSEDWGGRPPRAVAVSVRRAAQALERRGAVRRGTLDARHGEPGGTVLWLADADPPGGLRREGPPPRRELEAPLLEILRATTAGDVERWFREGYGIRGYGVPHYWGDKRRGLATWQRAFPVPEDGGGPWVPYQQLVQQLQKRQGLRSGYGGFYEGLVRVVARLEAQGAVQTRAGGVKWNDRAVLFRVRTYHAIRCLVPTRTHQATDTGA